MKAWHSRLLVLASALAGSQAGHLLTYQVRFGAVAQQVQSTGAHSYFPVVVKTGVGVAASMLIAGLFIVGLARVAGSQSLRRVAPAPSLLRLVALLFTIQLAVFAGQETVEAAAAGAPASSVAGLLLWGALGQLPVAAVLAVAMRWLLVRFETAVAELEGAFTPRAARQRLIPVLAPAVMPSSPTGPISRAAVSGLIERGPPPLRRVRQS